MFRYANPYDFEPRVAEGDQVDYMDIIKFKVLMNLMVKMWKQRAGA